MKKNIPTLLVGHSGCGKTSIVGATLMNSQDDLSFYKYNCITTSTAQNFRSWMMKKLEKKTTNTFGPLKSKGVLLIDNVEMPENEKESLFRDFISQMIENNSWYNLPLENSFNLENMYYVLCMTIGLKDSPETDYDKELYSRTWSLFNPEPHEDILARIFSSSMNATFRRIGFPPEISSVIPAIINSTLNVYNACRKALIIENEMCFLHIDTVNLRDIVNVLQCFSLLPKENADNKKLFTRLWVHEILRVFYDRLLCDDAKKMIYDSIRECVKNNFRENFESGFEHLGKINGLVTQQNLRNLMFGVYLSDNKKDPHYMEMTDVEQFEKKLLGKIKDFNASEDSQNDPVHLFPLRTTLEMISRICRQLNLPQGHMLIYGEGVEGRRITIRSAAILLGIKYIEVENYKSYDDLTWRLAIRDIIKRVGSMNEEIVLCLHFRQLERHDFLARDLDDFLTNGFIHDLFTTDEIHQINENVHKLMMENENNGGKSNSPPIDITPAILEKEFISNCEKKLHIMFIIDNDDTSVFEFLRSHRSIVGRSIVYRKEEWPEDTLKKAGDFVFEELSLSRKIKKALNQFCVFAYTEARKLSNKVKEKNIRISPSVYLRLLRHVVHIHSEKSGELEQRKSRLQIGIEKFNQVEEELKEFELELESIREKIQNVKKEKEEMKSTKFNLDELLESVKTRYEEVSSQLDEYIQQKGEKEHIYKDKLARIEDKYSGLRNSMGNLKISEIQALKNVKFNLPLLKLCLQCMNLYSINDGEKGLETDPKKLLDFLKKILNDPKFVANLIEVQLTDDTLSIFQREIFTSPDWDASTGYKIAYFLGLFIKWSSTLYDLLKIRKEVEPYVEEVNRLSVLIDEKELLKDETYEKIQTTQDKINDVEGKIKKIQSSYEQLMIELDRCLEKKSLGNLVYDNFKGVIEFWSNILSKIKEDLITLLGDVAFYSMDIVLCSPFTLDQRDRLRRSFEEKAIKLEILFSQNYLQQLLEPNTTLCWSHFIHARDEFSLSKLCTIKSNLHWAYIFNLSDEGYQILLSAEKDKKIEYIRYGSKGYLNKLENAVVGGFLTIIEDVSSYDYRLKNILTKNLITKKNDSGKVLEQWINIGENRVEYSNDFKLYLISSSSSIIKEYQSKCQLLNFQLASNMLISIFSDTILSQKNAKEKLKLDNVVNQMIRTTKSIEDLTDELLSSLDIEKSILDVPGLGNKLMENEKEFSRLRCLYDNLEMFQRKLNNSTDDDHSLRLAKKCSIIFEVIRKLTYLDNYDITLKKFLSIIKVSLMNKEHQDRIPIPEVLNQLRSMFSDRAHYSIFVFWLYFYLNFNGSNMNVLKLIEELMNGQCSGFFDEAISIFCDFFSEEKADLILDVNKNKLFFNLLPQPWLSRLNPFQIFVLKTIGQPHRVIDLAQEFSNNFDIDSTFVDVLESDFGQFPSSMSNKAIVLSTNDEESEEEIRLINKFSGRQKINSIFISFDEGIQVISDVMIKAQKLGKWIIITDYRSDNFEDLKKLIARNNFQVHKDFKLWILNYKRQIPKEIWRECLVINQSPPDTFHQRFTSLLVNGISDEEFMTLPHSESDPESGFGKMLDIFFRLALFHSCIIERIKYGPRGGWNIPYKFNQSHFRIVTELFKTHFIRLPFEHNRAQCLRAIIIDCFYKQYLSDERDFNLLSTMFHTLMSTSQINLKKISSVSDMVEVAKSLEENQIISLLNISQCTQSFYQFKKSKDFMKTLIMYPSGGEDVLLSQEVIISKLKLIRSVLEKKEDETTCGLFECTRKEDYILDYIWTIEIQELRKCISTIKDDIEYIFWVVNRETLINTDFTALWSPLRVNKVPLSWINHINKEEHTPTFSNFSSSLSKRINYFQTGFNKNIIELNALSHARIFLNGLVLHIMKESIETDGLCGSFIDEIPSLSPGNIFYLKGVKLEGASWDPRRSALIAETARLESFSIISLRKGNLKKKEQNYSCPFYLTQSRVLNDSSSSFHFNIYIPTLMSQEKHVEMSTAVMIEDFE